MRRCQPESNSPQERKVLVIPDWILRAKLVTEIAGRGANRESHLEHRWRDPGALRDHLVPARDQCVARQLHDRTDSMGGLRRDRSRGGDCPVTGCESEK